jgi:hypothetical protein
MPNLRPRRAWPTLPEEEARKVARSAHGAVLSSAYDYQNHLAFVRGRRGATMQLTHSVNTSTATPIGTNETIDVVWESSPEVEHVFIGFLYQCSASPATASEVLTLGSPIDIKVDASLYNHDTAALIDSPGCRWTYEAGHLVSTLRAPGLDLPPGVEVPAGAFNRRFEEAYAHTTRRIDDSAVIITDPRCLKVPTASKGATLRVRLVSTNLRFLSVNVCERYEEVVGV